MSDKKRILVTTIPAWSERSGANTFSSLLEGYGAEFIANVYTRSDLPDSKVAGRYFQILEWQVVKSIFTFNPHTGNEVRAVEKGTVLNTDAYIKEQQRYRFFTRNRWYIALWLREFAWKLGRWKSRDLKCFLDSFHPEVVIFSIESYLYYNRLNRYIVRYCKPHKVIGYLWDDNFTYKQRKHTVFSFFNRFIQRRSVKKTVGICDDIISISKKMKRECDSTFGVNSIVLTKPTRSVYASSYQYNGSYPFHIVYTGNLLYGRLNSIKLLVKAIFDINQNGVKFSLDIYTPTIISQTDYNYINNGFCKIHEAIPQEKVYKQQQNADILLFVEDVRPMNNIARLSFSTKITDYLSCRRCILAIGSMDSSAIEYFKEEDAALTCTCSEDIETNLHNIVSNPQILTCYADKAYDTGLRNHNKDAIQKTFYNIINS